MLSTGTSSCITFCFITPRAQHLQPLVHSLARTLARILAWIPRGHTAKSAYATSKNHSSLTRKGNHVIIDQATVPRAASLDSPSVIPHGADDATPDDNHTPDDNESTTTSSSSLSFDDDSFALGLSICEFLRGERIFRALDPLEP
jgi:hypothetical protein